ncbi:MAG: glycosyltransferase family 2 protein [Bacteroidia bacterium]|nr:glycosyltransferase family 2 protein [Bacteroidia bacterium]
MQPKVSVVILNYNTRNFLHDLLPFVLQTNYENLEVVVADNASSDDSCSYIEANYPQLKLIRLAENYGFAGGYNKALEQVQADYYVLLNSDVEVDKNWIQPLVDMALTDSTIAAIQPKILDFNNRNYFEYAGASGGFIDKYGYPFCRGRILSALEEDKGQFNDNREIFWATGAAMFVKAELFHSIGGLDADFFAHMEEIDICWRLKNAGYKIMACPASVVYHIGGGTLSKYSPKKTFLNFRNGLALLLKNLEAGKIVPVLMFRIAILDTIAALRFLMLGEWGNFKAVLKAHFSFYSRLRYWYGKRKQVPVIKANANKVGLYKRSIVYDFFLGKKHSFDLLDQSKFL